MENRRLGSRSINARTSEVLPAPEGAAMTKRRPRRAGESGEVMPNCSVPVRRTAADWLLLSGLAGFGVIALSSKASDRLTSARFRSVRTL